jgi:hypothetical protein
LLLSKVAKDVVDYVHCQLPVYDKQALDVAMDNIVKAHKRLIIVASLMPDAYEREVKASEPLRSVREFCGKVLMGAWTKLKL